MSDGEKEEAKLRTQRTIWYLTCGAAVAMLVIGAFVKSMPVFAAATAAEAAGFLLNSFLMIRTRVGYMPASRDVVRGWATIPWAAFYIVLGCVPAGVCILLLIYRPEIK